MMDYTTAKLKLDKAKGARENIQSILNTAKDELRSQKDLLPILEEAQALIQTTAKETQEQLRYHIEDIVNTSLDARFPGEYHFKLDFQIKRGKTEIEIYLDKDGERVDPMTSTGGGVVDIISFSLRLAVWSLSKTDNIIILDEPFKFLSTNLRPLAGEILKKLSEKLSIQVLMVTHDKEMIVIADRVFEISQTNGKSIASIQEPT